MSVYHERSAMTFGLTNISSEQPHKLQGLPTPADQTTGALREGDILEGIVTRISNKEVEVSFSMPSDHSRVSNDAAHRNTSAGPDSFKKSFPEDSIKSARLGEKRSFEVTKVSGDTFVLKDLGPVSTGDGKVTFTGVDRASLAQLKSFNDTMGIGEQDEDENNLDKIRDRMSDEDAAGFCDEGLSVKEYLAEQLESALDRVKLGLEIKRRYSEETGRKIKEETRELRAAAMPAATGREREIMKRLADADLPVTPEIVSSILTAQDLALSSRPLADDAKAVLIDQSKAPSITDYYKASSITTGKNSRAPISDDDFEALLPRIRAEVDAANAALSPAASPLEDTAKTTVSSDRARITADDARWLIDHDLPVTEQTLLMKEGLDSFTPSAESVLTSIVDGLKQGLDPEAAALSIPGFEAGAGSSANDRPAGPSTRDALSQVTYSAQTGIYRDLPSTEGIFTFDDEETADRFFAYDHTSEIAAVTARRRLEETRLTFLVGSRARGEAISGDQASVIDTVEATIRSLKAVEERYYSDCFEEVGDAATPEKIDTLASIVGSFDELKGAPAYILSTTLEVRTSITVTGLNAEGDRLRTVFARAEQTYEAVGTQIRGDLGDSISKAFTNIDELLELSGFEANDTNRRAARILGYNRMELSEQNMEAIKAYDLEVRGLIDAMKPVVAAELVKRGIDPLNIPISQLTGILKQMRAEKEKGSDEKYSEFLVRLDREGALTSEERSAYIGIYRLLTRIEKTDGAVIGDCLRRGAELTMGNLLSADRTRRQGHVDAKVNDSFGALEEIVSRGVSISEQILGAMTPGKTIPEGYLNMSPETFLEKITQDPPRDTENVDVEMMKDDVALAGEAGFEKAFLRSLGEPATIGNLLAMQEMVEAPDVYRKLSGVRSRYPEEITAGPETETVSATPTEAAAPTDGRIISANEPAAPAETFTPDIAENPAALRSSYEALLAHEADLVSSSFDLPGITSADALRLSRIGAQISLLGSFAKKDYYELPVLTGDKTVLINLTLRRGTDDKGLIGIRFRSESPVDITIRAGDSSIDGILTCSDRTLESPLKEALSEVTTGLAGLGYEDVRLFFAGTHSDERAYLERISGSREETENTKKLLDIAGLVTKAVAGRLARQRQGALDDRK